MLDIVQDERRDNDHYEEHEGIPFIIEKTMYKQYQDFVIDYVKNWLTKGFIVRLAGGVRSTC